MRGFVPTPPALVDMMVGKLFDRFPPTLDSTVLDPGCGAGAFVGGLLRWCRRNSVPVPHIRGIEADSSNAAVARTHFATARSVTIHDADFLTSSAECFDYIVGNPPYVPITELDDTERQAYRKAYLSARGRFDLYLLFFEQALNMLRPGGRLVFVTPEKFLYVESAAPLRRLLGEVVVEELHFVDEATFPGLVTYPVVTTVTRSRSCSVTQVILRDGTRRTVPRVSGSGSWLPRINGASEPSGGPTLADICRRVSCGVATGADRAFLVSRDGLEPALRRFAYPTIAGRQLGPGKGLQPVHALLVPYDRDGVLLPEDQLDQLGTYLAEPNRRAALMARTCVARKPWYAYHESPPLDVALRPKILCKDIGAAPYFVVDESGEILPRHSVYYIVPKDAAAIHDLAGYLNSPAPQRWLRSHCQRAANGFIRLQSHVLKHLPVPADMSDASREGLELNLVGRSA